VLHEAFLDFCHYFMVMIDKTDFTLTLSNPEINPEVFNKEKIFEKNKENIDRFYSIQKEDIEKFVEEKLKDDELEDDI
jgi:hypothetical protein